MASMWDRSLWTTTREKPNTYPVLIDGKKYSCLQIDERNGQLTVKPGGYPGTAKKRQEVLALLGEPTDAIVMLEGGIQSVANLYAYEDEQQMDDCGVPYIVVTMGK